MATHLGSFLARLGEAETCAEGSFFKSFSLHTFPPGTCAERSFSNSFSPRMSCPVRQFAHVTSRNLRKMAQKWLRGGARGASSQTFAAETCAKWPSRPPLRGEKFFEKFLSAHVSTGNRRGEKLFKKISPHRFRFRQAVPKRCRKGTRGHHDGNPLPS